MLSRTGAGSSSDSDSGRGPNIASGSSQGRIVEWAEINPALEDRMYYV